MTKKFLTVCSAVALAAVSLWVFTGVMAAPNQQSNPGFSGFSVKLDKESLKLGDGEDTSFNANIVFERTDGAGENPFQISVPVPAGTSLNGTLEDIITKENNAEIQDVSFKNGFINWETVVGNSGDIQIQIPLIVDKCPDGSASCKINVVATLTDGKEQSSQKGDSLDVSTDNLPLKEGDVIYEITSPGDIPLNQRLVTMQYRRTPDTGTNPFLMSFLLPDNTEMVGDPKVELDDAKGFLLQQIEGHPGFQGTVEDNGGVKVSFLLEIDGCPGGAQSCVIKSCGTLTDTADGVVVWCKEFNYIGETEKNGKLDIGLDLIGAGQIGGTLIVDTEINLTRDGGEEKVEGILKFLMPEGASTQLGNFEIQDLKADVGTPSLDGQTILIPVNLLPNATVKFLMPIGLDIGLCNNEVCSGEMKASFEYGDGESIDITKEFSEKVGESNEDKPNVTLDILADNEVVNPGDEVELDVYIEEIPSGASRMPGQYGFLLEVAGLKTTGDINLTLQNAGPEKILFDKESNGLKWEGEIGEEGSVALKAKFEADACKNGGSCSADARLTVILPDGTEMIRKASILIEDNSGFDPDNVEFRAAIIPTGETALSSLDDFDKLPIEGGCMTNCEGILLGVKNNNADQASVFVHITAAKHLKIGPPDGYKMQYLGVNKEDDTHSYKLGFVAGVSKVSALKLPVEIDWDSLDEPLEDDAQMPIEISTCVQPVGSNICEEADEEALNERSPQNLLLLYLIWRSRDFGDAPSNNNHFGAQMESYPGEAVNPVAKFPLARDLSILNPPPNQIRGPAHRLSNLFHLGAGVSPEFAIDRNWDADFTNNIEPSIGLDQANFDGFDDGVDISTFSFTDCGSTDIPVEVTITPLILDFFDQKDADGLAHINIWLDSDRSGQWGYDQLTLCNFGSPVSEHIVVDAVVDPIALGVGTHTVMVNAPQVGWSSIFGINEQPAWMRVMLTAVESNKDLYISFGDGRGEEFVYFGGETEDYYYVDPGVVSSSSSPYTADMVLDVDLIRPGTNVKEETLEFPGIDDVDGQMVIRFRNDGYKPAEALVIDGDFGPATVIKFGKITNLKCDDCTPSDPQGIGTGKVSFSIDKLEPGEFGEIILGWAQEVELDATATATVSVQSKEDFRPLNNVVSLKWPPIKQVAPKVELNWTGCLTCTRAVDDVTMTNGFNFIMSAPDPKAEKLIIFQDGEDLGKVFEMCDGVPCEDLGFIWGGDGPSQFTFKTVDGEGKESPASKPIGLGCTNDIVRGSLMIFDQTTGQRSVIPAEAYDNLDNLIIWLANGRKFKAVVAYCGDDPDPKLSMTVNGTVHNFNQSETLASSYKLYETSFLLEVAGRATTSLGMSVESNGTTYEDNFQAGEPMGGHVLKASDSQPINGAKILILEERSVEFGDEVVTTMAPWESIGIGQENPITTGSDGFYEISVPNGNYQIVVVADGYQTYRSAVLEVTDHMISGDIDLTEARPAPSNINISVNQSGFDQTVVQVEKGWVVKFINTGTDLHGAASADLSESSGLMAPGESFKMAFDTVGTFEITDPANGAVSMIVEVIDDGGVIYLPLIVR